MTGAKMTGPQPAGRTVHRILPTVLRPNPMEDPK